MVYSATTPTSPIMNDRKYDVIVIGTSPRGGGATMKATKEGRSGAVTHPDSLKIRRRNSESGARCRGGQAAEIAYIGRAIMAQQGAGQHPSLFRQYHVQLSDHGRSLLGRGVGRTEPAGLREGFAWTSLRISN